MPIYEYMCNECGSINDFLIGVSQEKTELVCKKCGSKKLERLFVTRFGVGGSSTESNQESCPTCSTCGLTGSCS